MRRLLATLRARLVRRDEGGTATVFVVGFAVVLLACAGLVIDGGSAINARMKLADDVEQAARAGAQQIDIDTLRGSNVVTLDGLAAEARARQYLNALGYTRVTVPPVTGDTRVMRPPRARLPLGRPRARRRCCAADCRSRPASSPDSVIR